MPLVRYRLGDRAAAPAPPVTCACGRTLPVVASIEGRSDDVLFTATGTAVGRLDPVFKGGLPVREAQIIQDSLQHVRVRYVPTEQFTDDAARSIVERLQARMGSVEVTLEPVDELPRSANGKARLVVNEMSPQEKLRARDLARAK
jgi:phenylacetate-CoA ligase